MFKRLVFIFLIILSVSEVDYAQGILVEAIMVNPTVKPEVKLKDVIVSIKEDNNEKLFALLKTDEKGHFGVYLAFDHIYLLTFSKENYISKSVLFNTKVPSSKNKDEEENFGGWRVSLYEKIEDVPGAEILDKPVAMVFYDEVNQTFDYDKKYSKSIQKELSEYNEIAIKLLSKSAEERSKLIIEKYKADALTKKKELELSKKEQELKGAELKNKEIEIISSKMEAEKKEKQLELLEKEKQLQKILSEQQENRIGQQNREAAIKSKEISFLNKDKEAQKVELQRQRLIRYGFTFGFAVMIVLSFFIFRNYKLKQKANDLLALQKKDIETKNEELYQQNEEISAQRDEIEKQKHIVEEHQKEMVDSMNYAKKIQFALLAQDIVLKENLADSFVLFKPKDIVSGDFYWATKKENRFYFAICDSTGHGVPGAFMSLLNISFLNEAINEKNISAPNQILDHARKRLIQNISRDGQQDGFDGILLCFENDKITYAAANNAPMIIRNNTIIELDADKMPVGKGEIMNDFNLYTIDTQNGDLLIAYTDGYADQFGGPKGKKFKYKPFDELILRNSSLSTSKQKQLLESEFESWKGNLEQVDDVLVVGIKV